MEALYIKYTKPEINLQITGMGRTLRLLGDKDTCHTTNSRIQHPALAVTTPNSPALPNTQYLSLCSQLLVALVILTS